MARAPPRLTERCVLLGQTDPGATRDRCCAPLPWFGSLEPTPFRFPFAASDLPDHSPRSHASTNELRGEAFAVEKDILGSWRSGSASARSTVAHGARARSATCQCC